MNGRSAGTFDPDGTVTIAEVITLAARLHKLYYEGSRDFPASDPWYESYVEYAEDNFIISSGEFDGSYGREATRQEVAWILCKAFPASALPAINELGTIPDLNGGGSIEKYYWASSLIRRMYEAGILTGSDSYGSFQGFAQVKRSEVAALAVRMADPPSAGALPCLSLQSRRSSWPDTGATTASPSAPMRSTVSMPTAAIGPIAPWEPATAAMTWMTGRDSSFTEPPCSPRSRVTSPTIRCPAFLERTSR